MADLIPPIELELRIALLPPISRGAHLSGPILHARRLVELWKVDDHDDVPLAQAFRLLGAEVVEGAIWRTLNAKDPSSEVRYRCVPGLEDLLSEVRGLPDAKEVEEVIWRSLEVGRYPDDSRNWNFPPLDDLLPALQGLSWRAMLDGTLLVEAIKGVRGKRHRVVLPAELPRLTPDWELSRLCRGASDDEFIDARVRHPPAEPMKAAWRKKPSPADLQSFLEEVESTLAAQDCSGTPTFEELQIKANAHFKMAVPRDDLRTALKAVPGLRRERGQTRRLKSRS